MVEKRVQDLWRQLLLLGYRDNEINSIVKAAPNNSSDKIKTLEHFEQLGQQYMQNYDK